MNAIFNFEHRHGSRQDIQEGFEDAYELAQQRVRELIEAAEVGEFPKHPAEGLEACMYCPVQATCLGRQS